jgi:hypothetical protein
MKYKIDTDVFEGGIISQELSSVDNIGNVQTKISRWIVDTREEDIKQALIKLGWTPPDDSYDECPKCGQMLR